MNQRRRQAATLTASTDALIARLAADVRPVRSVAGPEMLRDALFGGGVVAVTVFFACLGLRPDLTTAILSWPFWLKLAYTVLLAGLAWRAIHGLGSPEASPRSFAPLLMPIAGLAGVVAVEAWSGAPASEAFWLGSSWSRCPLYVAALAAPMTAGLLRSFRSLAPTRLRSTGFLAGLVSGAVGAAIYSLGCGETSPGFVLVWYSLGVLLPAVAGAAIAPRLLRW